jgi:hypothetical protein
VWLLWDSSTRNWYYCNSNRLVIVCVDTLELGCFVVSLNCENAPLGKVKKIKEDN